MTITSRWPKTFYGRAKELQTLKEAWSRAQEGVPQIVQVLGAEGVGKTRLVQAFYAELAANQPQDFWPSQLIDDEHDYANIVAEINNFNAQLPWFWWGVRFVETKSSNRGTFNSPFLIANSQLLEVTLAQRKELLKAKIGKDLFQNTLDILAEVTNAAASHIGVSIQSAVNVATIGLNISKSFISNLKKYREMHRLTEGEAAQQYVDEAIETTLKLLYSLLDRKQTAVPSVPVVLVLDDVHGIDDTSLAALKYIIDMSIERQWPLMLINIGERPLWYSRVQPRLNSSLQHELWDKEMYQSLNVEPLPASDIELLAKELLPGLNDTDLQRLIVEADGNPLVLRELVLKIKGDGDKFVRVPQNSDDACIGCKYELTQEGRDYLAQLAETDLYTKVKKRFEGFSLNSGSSTDVRKALAAGAFWGTQFFTELTKEFLCHYQMSSSNRQNDLDVPMLCNHLKQNELVLGNGSFGPGHYRFAQRVYYRVALDYLNNKFAYWGSQQELLVQNKSFQRALKNLAPEQRQGLISGLLEHFYGQLHTQKRYQFDDALIDAYAQLFELLMSTCADMSVMDDVSLDGTRHGSGEEEHWKELLSIRRSETLTMFCRCLTLAPVALPKFLSKYALNSELLDKAQSLIEDVVSEQYTHPPQRAVDIAAYMTTHEPAYPLKSGPRALSPIGYANWKIAAGDIRRLRAQCKREPEGVSAIEDYDAASRALSWANEDFSEDYKRDESAIVEVCRVQYEWLSVKIKVRQAAISHENALLKHSASSLKSLMLSDRLEAWSTDEQFPPPSSEQLLSDRASLLYAYLHSWLYQSGVLISRFPDESLKEWLESRRQLIDIALQHEPIPRVHPLSIFANEIQKLLLRLIERNELEAGKLQANKLGFPEIISELLRKLDIYCKRYGYWPAAMHAQGRLRAVQHLLASDDNAKNDLRSAQRLYRVLVKEFELKDQPWQWEYCELELQIVEFLGVEGLGRQKLASWVRSKNKEYKKLEELGPQAFMRCAWLRLRMLRCAVELTIDADKDKFRDHFLKKLSSFNNKLSLLNTELSGAEKSLYEVSALALKAIYSDTDETSARTKFDLLSKTIETFEKHKKEFGLPIFARVLFRIAVLQGQRILEENPQLPSTRENSHERDKLYFIIRGL